ncbi:MAG TPA: MFS transporter [Dehalococcoidia bacterium]|jgi:MFS family permease
MTKSKDTDAETNALKHIFRSLSSRNYRLFFIGQGVSLIGTWMQTIAMSWLVYRITGSAFLLGVVGFSSQLPIFILAPLAGVFVDRHNRHRILVITQFLAMLQAFILATLVLTNTVTVWAIIVLSVFLGMVNSVDMPARQTFVLEMVERKEDLSNAIALNSALFSGTRLIGPSIGGILIAALGEGLCFLINGFSFLSVIFCLMAMRIAATKMEVKETHVLTELKEGFSYAIGFAPIRYLLLLVAIVSLVGMPYVVLMPIFAGQILGGGPSTLGFLMAASGTGALIGTLYLAARKSVAGLGRIVVIGAATFGCGLILFSLSRFLPISLILIMLAGFGMIVQMASSNTILQTIVDDDKRGRVMSFYAMAFVGIAPFGSLLGGALASRIGAPNTLLYGGIVCIIAAIFSFVKFRSLKDFVHTIYGDRRLI